MGGLGDVGGKGGVLRGLLIERGREGGWKRERGKWGNRGREAGHGVNHSAFLSTSKMQVYRSVGCMNMKDHHNACPFFSQRLQTKLSCTPHPTLTHPFNSTSIPLCSSEYSKLNQIAKPANR